MHGKGQAFGWPACRQTLVDLESLIGAWQDCFWRAARYLMGERPLKCVVLAGHLCSQRCLLAITRSPVLMIRAPRHTFVFVGCMLRGT